MVEVKGFIISDFGSNVFGELIGKTCTVYNLLC